MSDEENRGYEHTDLTLAPNKRRSVSAGLMPMVVLLVVVAGGVVITQALSTAVDYYCNVDEVGERSGSTPVGASELGTVGEGTVVVATGATLFDIRFNGASVKVEYAGEPGAFSKSVCQQRTAFDEPRECSATAEVKHLRLRRSKR